jgi:hypothetical protein
MLCAQNNNYNTVLPRTINVKIIQPITIQKPTDYAKITSKIVNDLNNTYANREAQKAAFERMTNQAISDIQNNKPLGYSITLNQKMSYVHQESMNNIQKYYSSLTSGQIDPEDYTTILNAEVNNYFNFANLMNEVNMSFKNTIDDLKNSSNYEQITSVTAAIDDKCNQTKIACLHDYGKKNKRYSYYYNLGISCVENGIKITQLDFFNKINSSLIIPKNIQHIPGSGLLVNIQHAQGSGLLLNEINIDKSTLKNTVLPGVVFKVPSSYTMIENSQLKPAYQEWVRTYSDGTKVVILQAIVKSSSKEHFTKAMVDMKLMRPFRIGVDYDLNMVVTEIFPETSAYSSELKVGDKILKINNTRINHDSIIENAVAEKKIGDILQFEISRKGIKKIVSIKLKKRDDITTFFDIKIDGIPGWLFVENEMKIEYGDTLKNLLVKSIVPIHESFFYLNYFIYPSSDLNAKSNLEIFNEFKQLIRSVNDSVVFK